MGAVSPLCGPDAPWPQLPAPPPRRREVHFPPLDLNLAHASLSQNRAEPKAQTRRGSEHFYHRRETASPDPGGPESQPDRGLCLPAATGGGSPPAADP